MYKVGKYTGNKYHIDKEEKFKNDTFLDIRQAVSSGYRDAQFVCKHVLCIVGYMQFVISKETNKPTSY